MDILTGCYSFTGGSIPEYLKTIYIAPVDDNSGFGNPAYKDQLTQSLFDKFRNDNSFTVVETGGDAKLNIKISSVRDEPLTVNPGELVTENKITLTCEAEYYDGIKKKTIWKKNFSAYNVYAISNAQAARDAAIKVDIDQVADDILLAVVSGW